MCSQPSRSDPGGDRDRFWVHFVQTKWEQEPVAIAGGLGPALVDEQELLSTLVDAADEWRAGGQPVFGLWLDGQVPLAPHDPYLATSRDASLAAYVERVTATHAGAEFCLAHFGLQRWNPQLLPRVRSTIEPLLARVGLPHQDVDIDCFVGRYRVTPRGIHRDPASTFMTVVAGEKRLRLWPPEAFHPPDHHVLGTGGKLVVHGLDPLSVPAAVELVGRPGDVLYWPSTWWHCAADSGAERYSAAINIGLFVDPAGGPLVAHLVERELRRVHHDAGSGVLHAVDHRQSIEAPAEELAVLDELRALLDSGRLHRLLAREWLARTSAAGMKQRPATAPSGSVVDGSALAERLLVPAPQAIRWLRDGPAFLVAVSGRTESFIARPSLQRLLDALAGGSDPHTIELSEQDRRDPNVIGVVEWLASHGGIEPES